MRSKKALYTTAAAFIFQGVMIVTKLILPHFIILHYGSETNGLINSITQFLGYIVLLEGGIGAVVKAILYKALAKGGERQISVIMSSIQKFFRRVCLGLVIYTIVLCIFYPLFIAPEFDRFFTISLLLIIAFSSFMQYFFGFANQLLLQSDQRGYVVYIARIIVQTLSTIAMVVMILAGSDIRLVKAVGTLILAVAPIAYSIYVSKNYNIDKTLPEDKSLLKERWNGFAHQVAAFIHSNTDVIILSIFAGMSDVSVYTTYVLIVAGVRAIVEIFSNSLSATFGNIYASGEKEKFNKHLRIFNYLNLMIIVFVFTITAALIAPFVVFYTNGVNDANYFQPVFGALITIAEMIYSLRILYSNVIFVVGDFKQTMHHGFIEAAINIVLSLILIWPFGLSGIAIGTICGMAYRFLASVLYVHRKITKINIKRMVREYIVNFAAAAAFFITFCIIIQYRPIQSLGEWILYAIASSCAFATVIMSANFIFCNDSLRDVSRAYIMPFAKKIRRLLKCAK